ncbi:MAG: MFS transporter [Chloroflexi bacterium]|nr:MAG: MFS transporter [Chloroflexota bacterium]
MEQTASQNNLKRFTYSKTFIVGFGFLGISIIWPIFNQFIPIFLQAGNPEFERQLLEAGKEIPEVVGFGLAPSLALFIMTWDNIINVFIQPWVGAKSDHTWNRFGRRKPWILLGVPIAVVGFFMIPFAQSALMMAAFILITNFGMALFRSPTVSWLGDLYLPDDRSKANGIINLMGGVGALIAFFVGGMLYESFGRAAPFMAGGALLVVVSLVAVWKVKEPRQIEVEEEKRANVLGNLKVMFQNPDKSGIFVLVSILFWFMGYNALEAGLSSFAVFTLGISPGQAAMLAGSVTVTLILFALPAGLLGTKYNRRLVILIGLAGMVVLTLLGFFIIQSAVTFVIILVLAGLFWACVNVNSLPLVYDHGDEAKIGAYTGLYYFASQSAAVLGPTLGGITVDILGNQYRWLWLFSTLFMGLAFLTMTRVKAKTQAAA